MNYENINKIVIELLGIANCESWSVKPTNNLYVRHNSFPITVYELVNDMYPLFSKEYKVKINNVLYFYNIFWHENDTLAENEIMYLDKVIQNLVNREKGDNMKKVNKEKLELLKESLSKAKLVLAKLKEKENKELDDIRANYGGVVIAEDGSPIMNLVKGLAKISPTEKEWKENIAKKSSKEAFEYLLNNTYLIQIDNLKQIRDALYPAYQVYRRVESYINRYSGDK